MLRREEEKALRDFLGGGGSGLATELLVRDRRCDLPTSQLHLAGAIRI